MTDQNNGCNTQPSKRSKFASPDLTVLVGQEEKPFQYYSIIMATESLYIDNMLSSGMKESTTMTIGFPDIEEKIWLAMMAPLENPIEAREFSVDQALNLVYFYDKYEFKAGRSLCVDVFNEFLDTYEIQSHNYNPLQKEWSVFVDICRCADKIGMKALYDRGILLMEKDLKDNAKWSKFPFDYLKATALFIAKEDILLKHSYATKENVLSPIWPELFWLRKAREHNRYQNQCIPIWFTHA